MFKYLSSKDYEALSEYQQEKYLDEKRKYEAEESAKTSKAAAEGVAKDAIDKAKAEMKEVTDKQEETIKELGVKIDEQDKLVEAMKAENNRIQIAAKDNEKNGKTFDVALDEAMKEAESELEKFKTDKNAKVKLTLKAVGQMGLANISGISLANAQIAPGIIGLPNRRIHMRNIMNTGRMTTSDYHYLRELTTGEGDVDTWTENSGTKPTLDIDYIESVAPSQFIAGTLDISRKSLDDVPALRSSLSRRLLERYLLKEDQQILSGSGVSPQLQGILGIATAYDGSTANNLVDRILDATGQLEENEFYADGVILKPRDWAAILRTKGNTLEYTLPGIGSVVWENGVLTIGGVPVYKMNGMPANNRQFLIGDWMLGAQLLIREDPTVEFSYENASNFVQNKITVRVEGRVALPIYNTGAFVKGSTGATT